MDDVINVTGHRLGTSEVEDAMMHHEAVAEAAVVGFPHEVKGEGVYAYVVLKAGIEGRPSLEAELRALTKSKIAGYAVPDTIQVTAGLPKTRSGKIMRRILRKVAAGDTEDLGDTSTLAEPGVVKAIVEAHHRLREE
jgi:acetyl-CoA synthetase